MNISPKLFYRHYFKDLLKENPDQVMYKNRIFKWAANGASTFLVYQDFITSKMEWIGVEYNSDGVKNIISSNNDVAEELKYFYDLSNDVTVYQRILSRIPSNEFESSEEHYNNEKEAWIDLVYTETRKATHTNIKIALSSLKRIRSDTYSEISGRILNIGENVVISFWQEKDELGGYKPTIINYVTKSGYDPKKILYQSYDLDFDEFLSFYEMFDETPSRELSDEERKIKQLEKDLHMKKGQLDKAILDALASKPHDVNDLYASLEKQFKMPVVQIKSMFDRYGIGLDKVLSRKINELLERRTLVNK
jgi:hypothetical protein